MNLKFILPIIIAITLIGNLFFMNQSDSCQAQEFELNNNLNLLEIKDAVISTQFVSEADEINMTTTDKEKIIQFSVPLKRGMLFTDAMLKNKDKITELKTELTNIQPKCDIFVLGQNLTNYVALILSLIIVILNKKSNHTG